MRRSRTTRWLWIPASLVALGCATLPPPAEAATGRMPRLDVDYGPEREAYEQLMRLPIRTRNLVQNKERQLDRFLQTGSYGSAISVGKEILDDYIPNHAYAAFCVAEAYAAVSEGGKERENVEEALEYLQQAVEYGFRNVIALESTREFDAIRKEKAFQRILAHLKERAAEHEKNRLPRLREAVGEAFATPGPPFALEAKDLAGKGVTAADFAGKPLLVAVIRPYHDAVRSYLPRLREAAAYARSRGVAFLGALRVYRAWPRRVAEAKAFVAASRLDFPCVLVETQWARKTEITDLPAFVLVDAKGRVRLVDAGLRPLDELKVLVDAARGAK